MHNSELAAGQCKPIFFYVHAVTNYGPGMDSNTTATISRYFGQDRNLRQRIVNYTVTLHWDKLSNVEAKDIQRYFYSTLV